MKITEHNFIDFLIGFFTIPFMGFIFKTTILLWSSPESITDAMGIIYVALITGLYYVLGRKSMVYFTEDFIFSWAKIFGLVTFLLSFNLL